MKYLHITESSNWAKYIYDIFEKAAPGENLYLIKANSDTYNRVVDSNAAVYCDGGTSEYTGIISRVSSFDLVLVHNLLNDYKVELILSTPNNVRFHWLSWGDDIYCARGLRNMLYGDKTQHYLYQHMTRRQKLAQKIVEPFSASSFMYDQIRFGWMRSRYDRIKQAANRMLSMSTIVPGESDFVHRYFCRDLPCYPFFYGSLEHFIRGLPDQPVNGNAILVGNSAYPSNNHLESFDFIQANPLLFDKSKIIVPLAYGFKGYADYIENEGLKRFSDRFFALRQKVSYDEYTKILGKCGYAIMNHIRQQALGNLVPLPGNS